MPNMILNMRFVGYINHHLRTVTVTRNPRSLCIPLKNTLCCSRLTSVMKVLSVAEKNDAAKNIAEHLSRRTARKREGLSVYNKIYEFNIQLWNQSCEMIMTSVSGHLLNHEFVGNYRRWHSCHPLVLFDVPVKKDCQDEFAVKIKATLEREVKKCNSLIIWTDCDREGENIGFEIINVCQAVKPNIRIYRAKFSEITQTSIDRAIQTLTEPDKAVSDAVNVRSELDLRIGAAFTRFQTLRFQKTFPRSLADMLISYGSCQFPTLGFVVERFLAIEQFQSEPYWKLKVTDVRDNLSIDFSWARGRLFEKPPCQAFLDECLADPDATVKSVTSKPKSKWRPVPLDTVELEKQGSRKLRLSAKETMKIAEKLYTQGFISYPRTETNIFPKELDLLPLVRHQLNDQRWGTFAQRLINDGVTPRQGKKSDQAHPPIHPTKYASGLQGNEAKVYEFVVRHFLACLSSNAVGQETIVDIEIAGEKFTATGLQVLERNYLEVYIYEKWSDKEMPIYQEGQIFRPTKIDMLEEKTSPPQLLTEADLITLMDKHGIGTDATHAEHIDTIKSRQYVGLIDNKHLMPGKLGIGLVMGYDNMGFQMSKPNLRAELENDLKLICERKKTPQAVLENQINKYREVFKIALERANLIENSLAQYLEEQPIDGNPVQFAVQESAAFKCPKCACDMTVKTGKDGKKKYIGCMGYPTCDNAVWLPQSVENVEVLEEICSECRQDFHKLKFKFHRNMMPMYGQEYTTCIGGCDPNFNEALLIANNKVKRSARVNDSGYNSLSNSSRSSSNPNQSQVRTIVPQRPSATNSSRNVEQSRRTPAAAGPSRQSNNNDAGRTSVNTSFPMGNPQRNVRKDNKTESPSTWGQMDKDTVVMCNCQERARLLTTKKEGPNQGREFYRCAEIQNRDCGFFLWATDAPTTGNSTSGNSNHSANSTRNTSTNNSTSNSWSNWSAPSTSAGPQCGCHKPAARRTTQKEGPNKGRDFYCCLERGCDFFQWADEENSTYPANNQRRAPQNRNNTTKKTTTKRTTTGKRKCGVCGVEGHNRKNCPQNALD